MATFPVKWMLSDMPGAPTIIRDEYGSYVSALKAILVTGFGATQPDTLTYDVEEGEGILEFTGGHSFRRYQVIEIEGADQSEYNTQWRVSSVTTTLVRFTMDVVPSANGTGTITIKTPGLGWSIAHESGFRVVFKPNNDPQDGGSGCYLLVDNRHRDDVDWNNTTSTSYVQVYLAGGEDLSPEGDLINEFGQGGVELYSGTGSVPGPGEELPWRAVGDDKTVFFNHHVLDNVDETINNNYIDRIMMAFGDINSVRRPEHRDAWAQFTAAVSPLVGSPSNTPRENYFYYPIQGNGFRFIPTGVSLEERDVRVYFEGPHHLFPDHQLDNALFGYPGPTDPIVYSSSVLVKVNPIANGSGSRYVGTLPGILQPLQPISIKDLGVFESNGKLLLCLTFGNSSGNPLGHAFFDLTGPWY